jgi:hypothetical protein
MGLLEDRSTALIFIMHSGIPKAYNGWYSLYISTCVRFMCLLENGSTFINIYEHSGIPKAYNGR